MFAVVEIDYNARRVLQAFGPFETRTDALRWASAHQPAGAGDGTNFGIVELAAPEDR